MFYPQESYDLCAAHTLYLLNMGERTNRTSPLTKYKKKDSPKRA
nr:MAG TPA_asm: hypothetical protein [Caudoviricetes sp.]